MKIQKIFGIMAISILTGCTDFLDVVPDNIATIEMAFNNRTNAEKYLATCYSYIPLYGAQRDNPGLTSGNDIWFYTMEDASFNNKWSFGIANGLQNTSDPLNNYWDGGNGGKQLYRAIRDCNIFIENVSDRTKVADLDETERRRWIAEIKVMKAFYHYYLFQLYGPIPIVDVNLPISAPEEEVRVKRDKIETVANYIVGLIDEAVTDLPLKIYNEATEMGRITQPAALAIKAKTLLLAASPLFNGNTDYANFKDKDGEPFFPQTYDANKWKTASDACKEALDVALKAGHDLYDFKEETLENLPENLMYSMNVRQAVTERFNKELVWGCGKSYTYDLQCMCQPRILLFHGEKQNTCKGAYSPTLDIAEMFYSNNGVPIEEDKEWATSNNYNNRYEIAVATATDKYFIKEGYQTVKLHFNREPRFYGTLGFDGSSWYGHGKEHADDLYYLEAKKGQITGQSQLANYSVTGYYAKKLVYYKNIISESSAVIEEYPFPIVRLADLYLMYAEALNEATDNGEFVPKEVYDNIDIIRKRSGLEGVVDSWSKYSVNPEKPSTKEGMREIIRKERQIELALEGSRFHDLRRWKLARSVYNNALVRGWSIDQETTEDYYVIRNIAQMKYVQKDYLWPLKYDDIINNPNLIQNPGWQ
ncbi:RagB/SusD family nutrient uptake outer membrane protein [Bacteroides oleiciplenus]|uniref:RagB/SusD family nutrient uptake outer membrane protein n=1 Tax=Bacteroides oleiciplenus TaxID=626931 RepID=UPI0026DCB103|nr:RagB/SusD family nutrient uptake outer membrane protein [Bacteroides oleiciplenus]